MPRSVRHAQASQRAHAGAAQEGQVGRNGAVRGKQRGVEDAPEEGVLACGGGKRARALLSLCAARMQRKRRAAGAAAVQRRLRVRVCARGAHLAPGSPSTKYVGTGAVALPSTYARRSPHAPSSAPQKRPTQKMASNGPAALFT